MTARSASPIRYVIGIDGGGSGTRVRLTDATGETLAAAQAGPSALGQGVEQSWRNVLLAIEGAFSAAGRRAWRADECAVGIGLAGAIVATQRRDFLMAAAMFPTLALASDGFTTLLGAHAGRSGAVVAAGTGSIGEALRRDGTHVSIGGWGFPVGDEGSGARLGMDAMREAQRAVDGRAVAGPLVRAIQEITGATREALLAWSEYAGQREYAALAPCVFAAASTDPYAVELLEGAARSIDAIASALDPVGELPLVVTGGIGLRLHERLSPATRARLVEPSGDAIDGALRLIRHQLDPAVRTS